MQSLRRPTLGRRLFLRAQHGEFPMTTLSWLRLLAYSEREVFVRQRAREYREALLLNGGVRTSLGLAPLEPPLATTPSAGRPTPPRRPRRS
jgi:hypothetical protein